MEGQQASNWDGVRHDSANKAGCSDLHNVLGQQQQGMGQQQASEAPAEGVECDSEARGTCGAQARWGRKVSINGSQLSSLHPQGCCTPGICLMLLHWICQQCS